MLLLAAVGAAAGAAQPVGAELGGWKWIKGEVSCFSRSHPTELVLTGSASGRNVVRWRSDGRDPSGSYHYKIRVRTGERIDWALTCTVSGTYLGSFTVGTGITRHVCNYSPGCGWERQLGCVVAHVYHNGLTTWERCFY